MKSIDHRTHRAELRTGRTQGSGSSIVVGPAHGPALAAGVSSTGRPQSWRGTAYRALVAQRCEVPDCGRTVAAGELFSRRSGVVRDGGSGGGGNRLMRRVCASCGPLTMMMEGVEGKR